MHNVIALLTAPTPLHQENYQKELIPWGDGLVFAGTLHGKVASLLLCGTGCLSDQIDDIIDLTRRCAERSLGELRTQLDGFYANTSSLLQGDLTPILSTAPFIKRLSQEHKARQTIRRWLAPDGGVIDQLDLRWNGIQEFLQLTLPTKVDDEEVKRPATLDDLRQILGDASLIVSRWNAFNKINTVTDELPLEEIGTLLLSKKARSAIVSAWCAQLCSAREEGLLSVEEITRFVELAEEWRSFLQKSIKPMDELKIERLLDGTDLDFQHEYRLAQRKKRAQYQRIVRNSVLEILEEHGLVT